MSKLKAFFYTYYKSLTSVDYYKDILKAKTSFTVKYFLALATIISLILSVKISIVQIPLAQKAVGEIAATAREMFPQDLVITIQDNKWSLNKPEPFIVPLPEEEKPSDQDVPNNLVVFNQAGTIEDLEETDTLIVINAKNILVRESNGFRAYPLENLPNGTVTRTDFDGFVDRMLELAKNLPYVLVLFILIGNLFYYIVFQGSNVLTLAIIVWLISAITKKGFGYGESAKITAHAATLPLTILLVLRLVSYTIPFVFWFECIVLILAVLVVMKLGK